jgi:hypothetical protein
VPGTSAGSHSSRDDSRRRGDEREESMSLRMPRNRFEQIVADLLWELNYGERPMPAETRRALVEVLEMDEEEKERVANGAFYR